MNLTMREFAKGGLASLGFLALPGGLFAPLLRFADSLRLRDILTPAGLSPFGPSACSHEGQDDSDDVEGVMMAMACRPRLRQSGLWGRWSSGESFIATKRNTRYSIRSFESGLPGFHRIEIVAGLRPGTRGASAARAALSRTTNLTGLQSRVARPRKSRWRAPKKLVKELVKGIFQAQQFFSIIAGKSA